MVGTAGAELEPGVWNLGNYKEWSKFHWVNYGYIRLNTKENPSVMHVQLISNEEGSVVDEVYLKNRFM